MTTATDQNIDQLIEQSIEHVPETPDAHRPHYGMSFLIDLPLHNYSGNMQFVTSELLKLQYFPKFKLLQFKDVRVEIPPQRAARLTTAGSPEDLAQPFDPDEAEGALTGGSAFNRISKSARQCARLCNELFAENGYAPFESLIGYEYATARELIYSFLPLNRWPVSERTVLGEKFQAPFLDDAMEFLLKESPVLIGKMNLDQTAHENLMAIYDDVLRGAQSAWDKANSILDESEEDMQKTPNEKKGYDRRDRRFVNSQEPRDLLCLAHTGRKPIDERPLANAQKLQQTANEPMMAAAAAMTKAAEAIAGAGGVSPETLDEIIDRKVNERLQASAGSTIPGSATPQAAKCAGTKADGEPCGAYATKGSDRCATHRDQ